MLAITCTASALKYLIIIPTRPSIPVHDVRGNRAVNLTYLVEYRSIIHSAEMKRFAILTIFISVVSS